MQRGEACSSAVPAKHSRIGTRAVSRVLHFAPNHDKKNISSANAYQTRHWDRPLSAGAGGRWQAISSRLRVSRSFTSGYVTSPFCAPSRTGLMTGKFQTRFGYDFNPVELHNLNPSVGLPRNQQTMAAALRNSGGYATALMGKWHLGGAPESHPMLRGFDEYFGFLHEGHSYAFPEWNGVTSFIARRTLPGGGKGRWVGDGVVYTTEKGPYLPVYDANNPLLRASQRNTSPTHSRGRRSASSSGGRRSRSSCSSPLAPSTRPCKWRTATWRGSRISKTSSPGFWRPC